MYILSSALVLVSNHLVVKFNKKMEGIKANGIDCGWGQDRRTLYDLCCILKDDAHNGDIFYIVMVDVEQEDLFRIMMQRNVFNLAEQTQILYSSHHLPPFPHIQRKILSDYKFYSNTDDLF